MHIGEFGLVNHEHQGQECVIDDLAFQPIDSQSNAPEVVYNIVFCGEVLPRVLSTYLSSDEAYSSRAPPLSLTDEYANG